mgnify:CR=1 FL=1
MPTIKAKVQSNQNQLVAKKLAIGQFSIAMSDIADVDTSNGVIHAIDSVVLPE